MTLNPASVIPLIVVPLIAWRIYARIRRLIGRQPVKPRRLYASAILLPVLLLLIGSTALSSADLMEGLLGGVVIGVGLALVGLRLTRFENTSEGQFYVPNAHIGIALTVLLLGRIAWRFFEIYTAGPMVDGAPHGPAQFGQSPLTLLVFGTTMAYYTTYAIGVLMWRSRQGAATATNPP